MSCSVRTCSADHIAREPLSLRERMGGVESVTNRTASPSSPICSISARVARRGRPRSSPSSNSSNSNWSSWCRREQPMRRSCPGTWWLTMSEPTELETGRRGLADGLGRPVVAGSDPESVQRNRVPCRANSLRAVPWNSLRPTTRASRESRSRRSPAAGESRSAAACSAWVSRAVGGAAPALSARTDETFGTHRIPSADHAR